MYVKVTNGRDPNQPGLHTGDFLAEVVPPLRSDHIVAEVGKNAERGDTGRLITVGDVDFAYAIGAEFARMHVLEVAPEQTTSPDPDTEMFAFRYVWWDDPAVGRVAVITTRNIFILGENGKTIDRV